MKNLSFTLAHEHAVALLGRCPVYTPSPLLIKSTERGSVMLKDETQRMGLGAFKALGGVYAVARLVLGDDGAFNMPLAEMVIKGKDLCFVCASAGNHGMAVAAGARLFGAKARVHLSQTVPDDFAARLQAVGAEVKRSGENYEESVQCAISDARANGCIHLADGSWPGYTEPPRLVMEGYTVIAEEMRLEFEKTNEWPSHVYLQAGVGGFAAAITYMIRHNWSVQPEITVAEPESAPCIKNAIKAGQVVSVEGPVSNMGRLDCKTASMLAFEILQELADSFVTISDEQADTATKDLTAVDMITTPSGAAGYAALNAAGLPPGSRPLVVITEGGIR